MADPSPDTAACTPRATIDAIARGPVLNLFSIFRSASSLNPKGSNSPSQNSSSGMSPREPPLEENAEGSRTTLCFDSRRLLCGEPYLQTSETKKFHHKVRMTYLVLQLGWICLSWISHHEDSYQFILPRCKAFASTSMCLTSEDSSLGLGSSIDEFQLFLWTPLRFVGTYLNCCPYLRSLDKFECLTKSLLNSSSSFLLRLTSNVQSPWKKMSLKFLHNAGTTIHVLETKIIGGSI